MKTYEVVGGEFYWYCPGCECHHVVSAPRWKWSFDSEGRPTVSPSYVALGENGQQLCHCFIGFGKIKFLSCPHKFSNKTVMMPELP